jgi:hypothetical protein
MASNEITTTTTAAPAPLPAHLEAEIAEVLAQVPGDDGSGAARIVEMLLDASALDDLNAPWDTTSGRALAGKRLRILDITQRPSSYTDGPPIFLVVHAADAKTGERVTFTTSAVAVVLQLAIAYVRGFFPLLCDVIVAERPTQRGFYPYHLQVLAVNAGAGKAAADDTAS